MLDQERMQDHERLLHFPNLLNARDLGGYPTVDGAQTSWRSLVRADDLAQLTAEGVRALADYGVETVVDLRWPEEAALYPSPVPAALPQVRYQRDRKSTRLNSSHGYISYAVFCLKKKNKTTCSAHLSRPSSQTTCCGSRPISVQRLRIGQS